MSQPWDSEYRFTQNQKSQKKRGLLRRIVTKAGLVALYSGACYFLVAKHYVNTRK